MALYKCKTCGKTVERDSDKRFIKSLCMDSGKKTLLRRRKK